MQRFYDDKERKEIINKIQKAYNSSDLTIKETCKEIGISDGTYYNWKNKFKEHLKENKDKPNKQQLSETEAKVVALKKDKPFMGFKKISKQLEYSHGIKVSTRQVKKILTKNGLKKTDYPGPKKHPSRRFERLSRNEMWMMDIMNYRLKKKDVFI